MKVMVSYQMLQRNMFFHLYSLKMNLKNGNLQPILNYFLTEKIRLLNPSQKKDYFL